MSDLSPPTFAGLTKEEMRQAAQQLRPDLGDANFETLWNDFMALKDKADALKALGIAIHPTFGNQPKENHDA